MSTFDFRNTDPAGAMIDYKGQRYVAARVEPHRRQDGNSTSLIVWSTHCAACGSAMEFKTSLKFSSPNRRCVEHRKPGVAP
jgi:hypothetical protein